MDKSDFREARSSLGKKRVSRRQRLLRQRGAAASRAPAKKAVPKKVKVAFASTRTPGSALARVQARSLAAKAQGITPPSSALRESARASLKSVRTSPTPSRAAAMKKRVSKGRIRGDFG